MAGSARRGEIVLLLISVVLFLLTAEAVVRWTGGTEPGPTGYAPVNTDRRASRPLNSRGYRDRERPFAKAPGAHRLLSLGDSFAWGASVEFEDAYPQRLERGLTRRRGEPWEVVNLALPGLGTVDEAAQLTGEGMRYDPDVVVVGYVLNDAQDAASEEARRALEWSAEQGRPPSLLDHLALYRFASRRFWATAQNRRRIAGYRTMYGDHAPGWVAARQALPRMGALCRERGVPWVLAIFPLFGNPLDERYPFGEIHAKVEQAAAQAGAKVVDLLPRYRGLRSDVLVVNGAADEHPNEIAHRIAADALLRALDDVIPGTKPPASR